MKEHLQILELADQNNLPLAIDRTTTLSITAARELLDAGYLTGVNASSLDGDSIVNPAITLLGRQFLVDQKKYYGFRGVFRHMIPILKWCIGIATAILTAWLIQSLI